MPSLGDEKNAGKITRDLKDGKKAKYIAESTFKSWRFWFEINLPKVSISAMNNRFLRS